MNEPTYTDHPISGAIGEIGALQRGRKATVDGDGLQIWAASLWLGGLGSWSDDQYFSNQPLSGESVGFLKGPQQVPSIRAAATEA